MTKTVGRPPAAENKLAPRFKLKLKWRPAQHQTLPRKVEDNMEKKMKTHNFITNDMRTNINAVLDWLCCRKKKINEIENTDVEIVIKTDPQLKRRKQRYVYADQAESKFGPASSRQLGGTG